MAISLENLVDLPLLTYYDQKIKQYIAGQVINETTEIIFTTNTDLPTQGQKDILYVTQDSIYIWTDKWVKVVSSQDGQKLSTWGKF